MARYSSELQTTLTRDQAWQVACDYLGSQGFKQHDERGEIVWRKGVGAVAIPQFVRVVPTDGAVHLEAWVSGVAVVPGVYAGEQDLTGAWGFAIKAALKKRVAQLEAALGGVVVSRAKIQGPAPAVAPPAAAPAVAQAPPSWCADPTGRHQLRYWDGAAWTENVCDDGQTSLDPAEAG